MLAFLNKIIVQHRFCKALLIMGAFEQQPFSNSHMKQCKLTVAASLIITALSCF